MEKTNANYKRKKKKKQTQQTKWRKQRRNALRREFPMLAESTIMEYAYRIERTIQELATGQRVVRLKAEGWHKNKKHIITLKGQQRLQKQDRNKTTITVIDMETGKKIEVSFRVLLNSERRKRNSVDS